MFHISSILRDSSIKIIFIVTKIINSQAEKYTSQRVLARDGCIFGPRAIRKFCPRGEVPSEQNGPACAKSVSEWT